MEKKINFIIEKHNCENIEELVSLGKTYYKEGDIINKNYLVWQYRENPTGKPFLFISRESKSKELAGQYLVLPIKFNLLKEPVLGSLSLNTLTSPKFQGQGLFTKMAKSTYDDCVKSNAYFTIGFPNPQSYPGFVRKLDFQHLGDIPLLIKPLKYGNILFSYFKKNKTKHGGIIKIDPIKFKNKNIKPFDFNDQLLEKKYNSFWSSLNKQYKVSTFKDFTYLKWRYHDLPTRQYKVFYLEEPNEIKAVIILKAENVWGFKVGLILDFLVLENDISAGKQILKYTKRIFQHINLDFIAILHSATNEYSILRKGNYFKIPQKILPQKIHFIVRLNKKFPNSKMLFNLQNWKLTFGDYDVF